MKWQVVFTLVETLGEPTPRRSRGMWDDESDDRYPATAWHGKHMAFRCMNMIDRQREHDLQRVDDLESRLN